MSGAPLVAAARSGALVYIYRYCFGHDEAIQSLMQLIQRLLPDNKSGQVASQSLPVMTGGITYLYRSRQKIRYAPARLKTYR